MLANLFDLMLFWTNFIQWLSSLTLVDYFLILWPLIFIDLWRSIGKSLVLLFYKLYRRFKPVEYKEDFSLKVSLIIPAHNEEAVIIRSIESAIEADYPNKEIIVVDDGSNDQTYNLASDYARKNLIKLVHRDVGSGSKAGALNYGVLFASGEIIVTVDADTLIERSTIKEIAKLFSDSNITGVSGNVRILRGDKGANNLLVKLQAYEYLISLEHGRRFNSLINTLLIISGALGAFRKKLVENVGEFDRDTITEDFDLTVKLKKTGNKLVFAENAVSWTFVPDTWGAWRRQRIRWTRGQMETLWKHRNLFRMRGFNLKSVSAVYDMLLMDVIVLFLRFFWLFSIIFIFTPTLIYALILNFIVYLAIELVTVVCAGVLSPRKEDLKKFYLVPIVVLFYRPLYALIRFQAIIEWLTKKKSKW